MKRTNLLSYFTVAVLSMGCQSLDVVPYGAVSESVFYKTSNDAVIALNSVYAALRSFEDSYNGIDPVGLYSSDDVIPGAGWNEYDPYAYLTVNTADNKASAMWNNCYRGIFRANTLLTQIDGITMDAALKKRITAEARFLRAFYHFRLTRVFGGVPLLTTVQSVDDRPARSSRAESFSFVASEMTQIEADLPTSYTTSADKGRVTAGAAKAYALEAYLWLNDYTKAAAKAKEIVDLNVYSLPADYQQLFQLENENNAESIFEIQYLALSNGIGNNRSTPMSATSGGWSAYNWGAARVRSDFTSLFEAGDKRLQGTVMRPGDSFRGIVFKASPTEFFGIKKYVTGEKNTNVEDSGNFIMKRYADVLLEYAEALNELGRTVEAYPYVNQVRQRAGLAALATGLSQADFRQAIRRERQVEFFLEDIRGYDIRRWGIAYDVMQAAGRKNFVKGKHEIFPIPQTQIDLNPKLTQNPNY